MEDVADLYTAIAKNAAMTGQSILVGEHSIRSSDSSMHLTDLRRFWIYDEVKKKKKRKEKKKKKKKRERSSIYCVLYMYEFLVQNRFLSALFLFLLLLLLSLFLSFFLSLFFFFFFWLLL